MLKFTAIIALGVSCASCRSVNKTMRKPYTRVDFVKNDFELSSQVSASATTTKVMGINLLLVSKWEHRFHDRSGSRSASWCILYTCIG